MVKPLVKPAPQKLVLLHLQRNLSSPLDFVSEGSRERTSSQAVRAAQRELRDATDVLRPCWLKARADGRLCSITQHETARRKR